MKKRILLIISSLILVLLVDSQLVLAQKNDPLLMGVFPRRNATTTHKLFTPLAEYLSKVLNRRVKIDTQKDFPSFWKEVQKGSYDIVHYNQFHYVKSHKEFGYEVIVKNIEYGKDTLSSAIIVRADSGIDTIQDLRGKRIVFGGGLSAMVAYIGAKMLLRNAGLYTGDYIEKTVKLPAQAVNATYFGQSDAAGTADLVFKFLANSKRLNVKDIKLLAQGEQLVHLPWAVKSGMAPALMKSIQKALLALNSLDKGKAILKKAMLTGFSPAKDSDYDESRKMIKEVLNESYW